MIHSHENERDQGKDTWQFALESVYGPLSQWGAFGEEIRKLCEWADSAANELNDLREGLGENDGTSKTAS